MYIIFTISNFKIKTISNIFIITKTSYYHLNLDVFFLLFLYSFLNSSPIFANSNTPLAVSAVLSTLSTTESSSAANVCGATGSTGTTPDAC